MLIVSQNGVRVPIPTAMETRPGQYLLGTAYWTGPRFCKVSARHRPVGKDTRTKESIPSEERLFQRFAPPDSLIP